MVPFSKEASQFEGDHAEDSFLKDAFAHLGFAKGAVGKDHGKFFDLEPVFPGGKFHFHFYMLCCATTYACFRLRMHTRDISDSGKWLYSGGEIPASAKLVNTEHDSEESSDEDDEEDVEEDKEQTIILSLVVDMC